MTYTVIIKKEYCFGSNYRFIYDCPLARAIKEQHPTFPLVSVAGRYIRTKDDEIHYFNYKDWDAEIMQKLEKGKINSVTIKFEA